MQKTELRNPPVEKRTAEAEGPPAKKSKTEDESVTKEKTPEENTQVIKEPSSAVEEQAMDHQSLPEDIKTDTMDEQTEETTAEASKQMEEHPGVESDSDEEKGG